MNRQSYFWPQPPRLDPRTGAITPAPGAPVRRRNLMAGPSTAPQPNHCGMSQHSADCAVEQLRPLNFTRSENVLLALIAGGVIGYFVGREWR